MYKCVLRHLFTGPNASVKYFDACVLALKCDKSSTSTFRLANSGAKGLRTCSIQLCEKSDEVSPPKQEREKSSDNISADDVKTNASAESPNENTPLEVALDLETTTSVVNENVDQPPTGAEQTKPIQGKVKSGKESLLDLLGAMKVDVTSKRKLKNLKHKQELFSKPKEKRASLESTISMFEKATVTPSPQSETLAPELVAAASAVASTLPNPSEAESELLQQLRQHETITETQKKGDGNNIGVIIAEMKIGKNPNRLNARPANQIRFDDDGQGYTQDRGITGELDSVRKRRNLFTAKRLNIFSPSEMTAVSTDARPTLWDIDFAKQLSTVTNQMPRNGFEEMIQWTHQGKLWQYPIDNEAGIEEEASVPFHEHIFLEKHLEEGFPRQGPIRHFMELVVAGLSKNPHLTVQQKKDHIFWFKDYFCQKEEVLKEDDVYLN